MGHKALQSKNANESFVDQPISKLKPNSYTFSRLANLLLQIPIKKTIIKRKTKHTNNAKLRYYKQKTNHSILLIYIEK